MISVEPNFFIALMLPEHKLITVVTVLKCGIIQFSGYIKTTREKGFLSNVIYIILNLHLTIKVCSFHTNNKKLKMCNH